MTREQNPNIEILMFAVERLDELAKRFQVLMENNRFVDAVSGHMPTDETSQARVTVIKKIIKELANLK